MLDIFKFGVGIDKINELRKDFSVASAPEAMYLLNQSKNVLHWLVN